MDFLRDFSQKWRLNVGIWKEAKVSGKNLTCGKKRKYGSPLLVGPKEEGNTGTSAVYDVEV